MSVAEAPPPAAVTPRPAPWKWSRADYYRLGELGFFQGRRVELIRGEIVAMSPMGSPHCTSVSLALHAVGDAFGPGYYVRVQMALALAGSEPEPDVAVVAGTPRDYLADHPTTARLVVEVADTSLSYDLTVKAEVYAAAGVPDYWVLDLAGRVLHVLRDPQPVAAGGTAYRSHTLLGPADRVAPLAAPTAAIAVADLLP